MRIPAKINPCPIVDATIGISFEPNIVYDAIFGIVFNAFKHKYPKATTLPILQLPEEIRLKDPNLINQPHYKISNDTFRVLIGPKGIALSNPKEYVGWGDFLKEIFDLFARIVELDIIKQVTRVGLRYINFFDLDIYDKINLKVQMGERALVSKDALVKAEVQCGDFISTIQVTNNASAKIDKNRFLGSVIDIDTHTTQNLDSFLSNYLDIIVNAHNEEKKLFFSLLETKFLASLNPTYIGE